MFPEFERINNLVFSRGNLVLPNRIHQIISGCLESHSDDITHEQNTFRESYHNDYNRPPEIDYSSNSKIDAYTTWYLPRNSFIPKISLSKLSRNKDAVDFPSTLNVLDLGTGTGAIPIGLFDLFENPEFSDFSINLTAVDHNEQALNRQGKLINASKFLENRTSHNWQQALIDIKEEKEILEILYSLSWDLIFSANLFNELDPEYYNFLIVTSIDSLSENGSLIIYEPAINRGREVIVNASAAARAHDLNVFYPCKPDYRCRKKECWMWNEYEIKTKHFRKNGGIIRAYNGPFNTSNIIINKSGHTIFDELMKSDPERIWTVGAPYSRGKKDIEFCGINRRGMKLKNTSINRGALCGVTRDFEKVEIIKV
ncbi:hypothetical protein CEE37_01640 [candidate division LCP-89 bacterium B3_LCP]|uniref:Methyltransferase domain-containing protein n=1 Tax=candidate division LCP-89 bacterium B3_LCP TaxID=2012998 RepID=A0A532V5E6_UNCL8|nr:MAG: hypothetical protein CEE37_01640 [candidate division LCP-89 bacterium B3_LCP]